LRNKTLVGIKSEVAYFIPFIVDNTGTRNGRASAFFNREHKHIILIRDLEAAASRVVSPEPGVPANAGAGVSPNDFEEAVRPANGGGDGVGPNDFEEAVRPAIYTPERARRLL